MPKTSSHIQGLQAEYGAKVAADLQRNAEKHEQVTAQITELQEQLQTLERDREMLLSMQRAVGEPGAVQRAAEEAETGRKPAARKRTAKAAKKTAAPAGRGRTGARRAAKNAPQGEEPSEGPASLVDLVHAHLTAQGTPRSAGEVAAALSTPQRPATATAVRTALEALVRRAAAHRSKQGHSVYYEPVNAPEPTGPQNEDAAVAAV